MECTITNRKQVKLDTVVNAAIVDLYEDSGRYFQRANFMAARGLKKLYAESLPKIKHKAWLPVNSNTHTATLPLDWDEETFIGFVDERWHKVPLKLNTSITDTINIIDVPCENPCPKCNQDTGICNDLTITEDTEIVVINDTPYNKTIIKKLYPNGDYYLETTTPVLNIDDDVVEYVTSKQFITNFDLKPCGCLDTTPLNTSNLITFCPDIYCNYYAPCDCRCNLDYGYKIFEESGLIQMDQNYPFDKVYVEYNGYISKIGGQYYVPQIAFETLVEYTKFKLIQNKRNLPLSEREWQKQNWLRERGNFEKINGRIHLSMIVQAIQLLPKFDVGYQSCFNRQSSFSVPTSAANLAAMAAINGGSTGGSGGGSGQCSITNNNYITINNHAAYTLAVKVDGQVGHPVAGATTYQNNLLIGAFGVEWLILTNQVLSLQSGQFTINYSTGVVNISPNVFVTDDVLIINYNRNT